MSSECQTSEDLSEFRAIGKVVSQDPGGCDFHLALPV